MESVQATYPDGHTEMVNGDTISQAMDTAESRGATRIVDATGSVYRLIEGEFFAMPRCVKQVST
jgi:hypothetical protein